MSTTSPQQDAAIDQAKYQSELSTQMMQRAAPAYSWLNRVLGDQLSGGPDQLSPMVKESYDKARGAMADNYSQIGAGNTELIKYRAKTAGAPLGEGFVNASIGKMGKALSDDYSTAVNNLNFQEAQTGLQTYNSLMQILGQSAQSQFQLAQGFGGAANGAIQGLSNQSQFQGALGGAISGAGLGASTGNVYAVAGGAIAGGILGALGSG